MTPRPTIVTSAIKIQLVAGLAAALACGAAQSQTLRSTEIARQKRIDAYEKKLICKAGQNCAGKGFGLRTRGFGKKRSFKFVQPSKADLKTIEEKATAGQLPKFDEIINFAYNSDDLTASAQRVLADIGSALMRPTLRQYRIILIGHTDAKGSRPFNQDLSERRARQARKFLLGRFPIEPDRIVAYGRGKDRLRSEGAPEAAINRRVEFINAGSINAKGG